jgi:hypothetical protein
MNQKQCLRELARVHDVLDNVAGHLEECGLIKHSEPINLV